MTFKEFQKLNKKRCDDVFESKWPVQNWCLAIAGEAGELCNIVKKVIRGDFTLESKREEILLEVADVITYCDLLISELEADTEQVLMTKFNLVSMRRGWKNNVPSS